MLGSVAGSMSFVLLFGLLKILAYSFVVISILFTFLMLYPLFKFLCNETFGFHPYHTRPFAEYFSYTFTQITLLPCNISALFRTILSSFKNQLSEIIFCYKCCYLYQTPTFPARDIARIPLIESLNRTYDFDMFGVCESMLTNNISNHHILINGFSPDPFRPIQILIPGMEEFLILQRIPTH